ncbi:CDP-glucose 4,6-dehydratase [Paenibacillus sp. 2003]|uniref:CDP-glucose 4,6-dehydratase n=1 Tax=Paenibacillus TaxID=44249 RepID=UPI0028569DBD|nr:CDP-glucose 4,6-dehydratase [Paenibacillus sp. 2003]MDR6720303.1 CDP-glucose 4,6-dehydratase [Paenibacillus sp. 2003]
MVKTGFVNRNFWLGKNVFITGHTGFKGSWLTLWLHNMGAKVTGYSLDIPSSPSLFKLGNIEEVLVESTTDGNVTDLLNLTQSINRANPEIIIHMAAQPLVRKSYESPVETYATNVMGTVNVMEAARSCSSVRVILNVTTDKCYENQEWEWGYREIDLLGGHDPYSSSKACSELITSAYRRSFLQSSGINVATARAGNVIGGGDWAEDRLIPDFVKSLINGEKIHIRNPGAIRPWQHVLEPLSGYLLLCQNLYSEEFNYAEAWNFGPQHDDARSVDWIVNQMLSKWPHDNLGYNIINQDSKHEANMLKLDCSKALKHLNWFPKWSLDKALDYTVQWYVDYLVGKSVREVCEFQISQYEKDSVTQS